MAYFVRCTRIYIHALQQVVPLTIFFSKIDVRTTFQNIFARFVLRSAIALPVSPEVDALIDGE